jgi:hypothetical protein
MAQANKKDLVVVNRAVSELIPYVNNAKNHSDKQIEMIVDSIREFGFNNPILTDGQSGVIAGHGRLMAANKLGLVTVPTIELCHLSDERKKAYILADNKLANIDLSYDDNLLMEELESISSKFDLSLTGFDSSEVARLFDETKGILIESELSIDDQYAISILVEKKYLDNAINLITELSKEIPNSTVRINE